MGGLTVITATLTGEISLAVSSISLISGNITALTALTANPETSPITETCLSSFDSDFAFLLLLNIIRHGGYGLNRNF